MGNGDRRGGLVVGGGRPRAREESVVGCGSGTLATDRRGSRASACRTAAAGWNHGSFTSRPSKLTLGRFLTDEWLPAKRATVKETTFASYEVRVSNTPAPRLGGVPLLNLGAGHLNTLYADLLAEGRSATAVVGLADDSARFTRRSLTGSAGRLPARPGRRRRPPRPTTVEMSVWSPSQLRQFLEFGAR